jgi:protein-S-isoprenylcysteine O-methyltransferase Ste14
MEVRFKKLRLWVVYPYFIIYALIAHTTDQAFRIAAPFVISGILLRLWASAHVDKNNRLTTSGPYAYLRNPLYVGSFLIGLGIAITSSNLYLIGYFIVFFSAIYYGTIRREEKHLKDKFGSPYINYLQNVSSVIPHLKPYPNREVKKFSFKKVFKNGEFIRIAGTGILLLMIYFREEFWQEKTVLDLKHVIYMVICAILMGVLFSNIYMRRKYSRIDDEGR